jgi:hypothetical protein
LKGYEHFLRLILRRYEASAGGFTALLQKQHRSRVIDESEFHRINELSSEIQLDSESFYLFGKIVLDKLAKLIEDYFRPDHTEKEFFRGYTFEGSHHVLTKNFPEFANRRKLEVPKDFIERANEMRNTISDFRDDHIAHKHNMRSGHGTMFVLDGSSPPRIMKNLLYPNEREIGAQQIESKPLTDLMSLLESYFSSVFVLIANNRQHSFYMRQKGG